MLGFANGPLGFGICSGEVEHPHCRLQDEEKLLVGRDRSFAVEIQISRGEFLLVFSCSHLKFFDSLMKPLRFIFIIIMRFLRCAVVLRYRCSIQAVVHTF